MKFIGCGIGNWEVNNSMEELNAAGDPVDNANEDDGNDIGILVVVFLAGTYYI